ncbi:hypothetical protein [Sorangium sp. So ce1335]
MKKNENLTQRRKGAKAQRRKEKDLFFASLHLCAFALISGLPS